MSSHRYAPEFKDEAVRQIVDRGYSVTEVSQRLGVSSHSLYKWVKDSSEVTSMPSSPRPAYCRVISSPIPRFAPVINTVAMISPLQIPKSDPQDTSD
jgi:transposase-like protein